MSRWSEETKGMHCGEEECQFERVEERFTRQQFPTTLLVALGGQDGNLTLLQGHRGGVVLRTLLGEHSG